MNNNQTEEKYSNFITQPDILEENSNDLKVLIVDAEWEDVEALGLWSQSSDFTFDAYLYHRTNNNIEWLNAALKRVNFIIVCTDANEFSPLKDRLLDLQRTYYYGGKTFLNNPRHYSNPIECLKKIYEQITQKV